MSTKNKLNLKADFQTGSDITQEKFEHLIDSSVNKVDDLSIDTNGNVGIGTPAPGHKLQVNGNAMIGESGKTLKIGNIGHSGWAGIAHTSRANKDDYALIQNSNGCTILNSKSNQGLHFRQGNSDKMVIKNGNVGIGTMSPSAKLEVRGNVMVDNPNAFIIKVGQGNARHWAISREDGMGYSFLHFRYSNSTGTDDTSGSAMSVKHNGNVGIGTTSPSEKLEVSGNMKVTHIVQEDWQDLTLANGWARYSTTYNPPQYFKDSQGIVHLRGLIKDGTAAGISTLPTGYRPPFRELHIGTTNPNASCRIDITKAGVITLYGSYDAKWVSLDGITFRTV